MRFYNRRWKNLIEFIDMSMSLYKRNEDILASEVGGETVMMSIEDGKYFGLNKTGTIIWQILETPMSLENICIALTKKYKIQKDSCVSDIKPFIDEMLEEKIIIQDKIK